LKNFAVRFSANTFRNVFPLSIFYQLFTVRFSSTSFENGFCLQLIFKKCRTENEFEFTTKIAAEIEFW